MDLNLSEFEDSKLYTLLETIEIILSCIIEKLLKLSGQAEANTN